MDVRFPCQADHAAPRNPFAPKAERPPPPPARPSPGTNEGDGGQAPDCGTRHIFRTVATAPVPPAR
ncbi:hypothetical protein GCM10010302_56890 [Streptomyces polychromogenes]|uniref:Uncharacterized protein n=1 Tax=Streptomyces polychromogenes TaxID=67342 RepID=A0ABP3F8R3_9ACTN